MESFILTTLENYQEQIALNIQSAEVGNQIVELLQSLRSGKTNTQVNSHNSSLEVIDVSIASETSPETNNANSIPPSGQLHNAAEVKVTKTEKGKPCIMENGYTYTMHRINGDVSQCQCVERNSCKARIHTTR